MKKYEIINYEPIDLDEICEMLGDHATDYKKLSTTLLAVLNDVVDKYNNLLKDRAATERLLTKILRSK